MKKVAMLIIVIMLVIPILGGCSCDLNATLADLGIEIDTEEESIEMVEYINERYEDDTFVFRQRKNSYGSGVSRGTPGVLVDSEKYPDANVNVLMDKNGSFYDNYLYYKFEEQVGEYLTIVLDEIFNHDYKLNIDGDPQGLLHHMIRSDLISADASFEEYLRNSSMGLSFFVVLPPDYIIEDKNGLAEMINDTFSSYGIPYFSAWINFCEDQEVYDALPEGIDRRATIYYRPKKDEEFLRASKLLDSETEFVWDIWTSGP